MACKMGKKRRKNYSMMSKAKFLSFSLTHNVRYTIKSNQKFVTYSERMCFNPIRIFEGGEG
jgi:hypothetical protein